MIKINKKDSEYQKEVKVIQFLAQQGVIVVHPDQNIIHKITQQLKHSR